VLWLLVAILVIAWICGFVLFHIASGLIHLLLVIAIVVVLWRVIRGKKPV
jgi:Family of unknown function (DUF5670)